MRAANLYWRRTMSRSTQTKAGKVRQVNNRERAKDQRGRQAETPQQIPGPGWRDIFLRVKEQIGKDNISIVSAGIAFYSFLALFPALIATIMIYGLLVDPASVEQQLQALTGILPSQAQELIGKQLSTIAVQSSDALGWGGFVSIVLALWSANKGMKALFTGINIAYDEEDQRGFIKMNLLTLLFTLGAILVAIVCAFLIVAFPVVIDQLDLPVLMAAAVRLSRWLILLLLILVSVSLLYRYAADRARPKFRWVSWGAVIATFLWLIGSWAFSAYVANFGNYNATYGSIAAVIIVLLWLMLTNFFILLGAEINSEMEGQTKKDSTTGEPKPKRRAWRCTRRPAR